MFDFFAIVLTVCALVSFINRKFFGLPFAITLTFSGLLISGVSLLLARFLPGVAAQLRLCLLYTSPSPRD